LMRLHKVNLVMDHEQYKGIKNWNRCF
jgi:hypothetical protein